MSKNILMCPPTFFDIEYEINVWMNQDNQVANQTAYQQWSDLLEIYTERLGWKVSTINPVKGLPDLVFATDCCTAFNGKILLSNFRYPERQPESTEYGRWFSEHGYKDIKQAAHYFEGGGDNIICGNKILAGYGFRSDAEAANEMREYFDCEVVSLHIIDPKFYHMDTSLAVLSPDTVAFYPEAIDRDSQERLRAAVPNIIEATLEEASGFGLNAVSDGHTVIASNASASLLDKYREAGFEVIGTSILEFRKSGGGVKCLTLELPN